MISKRQIDLMEQYSKVRKVLDKLTLEEKKIKEELLTTLDKTENSQFGIFTPVIRTNYTYSKNLTDKEKQVQQQIKEYQNTKLEDIIKAKKLEELDGTAKATEIRSMQFRAIKEAK